MNIIERATYFLPPDRLAFRNEPNSSPISSCQVLIYWSKSLIYIMMKAKIMILGLMCLLALTSVFPTEIKYIYSWQDLFPDQLERVYIIMKDGIILQHSSQQETMIDISTGRLKEELKKINRNIQDIEIVIHNHRMNKYFTRSDYKQYWAFKNYGFDGRFLLYCHRTKEVYDIEDK